MPVNPMIEPDSHRDELLAAYLVAEAAGQTPDRAQLLSRHPELADELASFFADHDRMHQAAAPIRRRLAGIQATSVDNGATALLTPGQSVGNYELLEELGRGGMGIVYKARQAGANRVVALKMLAAGPTASPAEVRRLRTEAEAVAALDHPSIVPLYEVGEHAGLPFFSMKLIEGGSLAAASGRFRRDPRAVAQLLAAVARAVHHAHERGILHRDLKPANVLLAPSDGSERGGPACEWPLRNLVPIVTDFGLARRLAEDPGSTPSGIAVGTPCYMAPEQVTGRAGTVTTAADVYGLGSILYELLTGQPPFRGASSLETLIRVLDQEPVRPRALDPAVHRDLETVCLKCLEKVPTRRYPTARAVAEDLERFLAGEPILARPVGPAGRLWRFCRRRPALAGLSVALLLVLLGALAVVTALWRLADDRLDQAQAHLERAGREQLRADSNYRQARQAVEDFSAELTGNPVFDEPGATPMRRRLLEVSLRYYRAFRAARDDDPALRAELAATRFQIGRLTALGGSRQEALAAYDEAGALYADLVEHDPRPDFRQQLARAHTERGILLRQLGRPADAAASFTQALTLYESLVREQPTNPGYGYGLATVYQDMGVMAESAGRLDESRSWYERSRDLCAELVQAHPDVDAYRARLADAWGNLGALNDQADRADEDGQAERRAVALREELVRARPTVALYRARLAAAYSNLGVFLLNRGQHEPALRNLKAARVLWEELTHDYPDMLAYQTGLAACHRDLGNAQQQMGQQAEGLRSYQTARNLYEALSRLHPQVPRLRAEQAVCAFNISTSHSAAGERDPERAALQEAAALLERVVAEAPDDLASHGTLGRVFNNLALILARQGKLDDGIAICRRAIEQQRIALAGAPGMVRYRQWLDSHYGMLAELLRHARRSAEAAAASLERRTLSPADAQVLFQVARDLSATAGLADVEPAERRVHADSAMAVLRQAVEHGFRDAKALREHPAFQPLRSRQDFQELVGRLQAN